MLLLLISQITLLDQQTYPGATSVSMYMDFSGDGVMDPIVLYAPDSLVIYDSLSTNPLGKYVLPPGFTTGAVYRISPGVILFTVTDPVTRTFRFYVYENFNNLVFTSQDFNFLTTAYAFAGDYDGDGFGNIIVHVDNTVYVYSTPYTLLSENDTRPDVPVFRFDAMAKDGNFVLPLHLSQPATMTVVDQAGRTVREIKVYPGAGRIHMRLPAGTYTYSIDYGSGKIRGKLVIY